MEMVESLQATVETLQQTIIHKDEELSELRRLLFGRKSERIPSVQSELKKRRSGEQKRADRERTKKKRDAARKAKEELPAEEVVHEVGVSRDGSGRVWPNGPSPGQLDSSCR